MRGGGTNMVPICIYELNFGNANLFVSAGAFFNGLERSLWTANGSHILLIVAMKCRVNEVQIIYGGKIGGMSVKVNSYSLF